MMYDDGLDCRICPKFSKYFYFFDTMIQFHIISMSRLLLRRLQSVSAKLCVRNAMASARRHLINLVLTALRRNPKNFEINANQGVSVSNVARIAE